MTPTSDDAPDNKTLHRWLNEAGEDLPFDNDRVAILCKALLQAREQRDRLAQLVANLTAEIENQP